jgi:hypothetical protein
VQFFSGAAPARRGALSPDLADAVVLTFAQPVPLKPSNFHRKIQYPRRPGGCGGELR